MEAVERGKQWAILASGRCALVLLMIAFLGLATAKGLDGKLTAVIVAVMLYAMIVGSAFALGFLFGSATETSRIEQPARSSFNEIDTGASGSAKPGPCEPGAGLTPVRPAGGFGRKQISGAPSVTTGMRPTTTSAPRTRLSPSGSGDIACVVVMALYVAIQVGPPAWNRAGGDLLALPYYALLIPLEGLGNILGLR